MKAFEGGLDMPGDYSVILDFDVQRDIVTSRV